LWQSLVFATVTSERPQNDFPIATYDERQQAGKSGGSSGYAAVLNSGLEVARLIYFDDIGAELPELDPITSLLLQGKPDLNDLPEGTPLCGVLRATEDGYWFQHWTTYPLAFRVVVGLARGEMEFNADLRKTLVQGSVPWAFARLLFEREEDISAIDFFLEEYFDYTETNVKPVLQVEELGGISHFIHTMSQVTGNWLWWNNFRKAVETRRSTNGSSIHIDSTQFCPVCGLGGFDVRADR